MSSSNNEGSLAAPVAAGLAAGIGFVILFALFLFHGSTLSPSSPNISNKTKFQAQSQQRYIEEVYPGLYSQKNTTITINYREYYLTTLKNIGISSIPHKATFAFHKVIFSFPYGSLLSPGGAGTVFEIRYPDGTVEKFGNVSKGYGEMALSVSSIPGAEVPMADTILGKHQDPNAGVAIYNKGKQVKLLVSK
jgi:hypothetical protein